MTSDERLVRLGWDDDVAAQWDAVARDGLVPARVAQTDRGEVTLLTGPDDTVRATAAKKAKDTVAGDWVHDRLDHHPDETVQGRDGGRRPDQHVLDVLHQ